MNKKPPFSFLGLVAVAAAAAIVLPACSESRAAGDEQKQQAQQQRPAPMVGVVTMHAGPVVTQADLPGRLAAHRVADVRPQVGGIIDRKSTRLNSSHTTISYAVFCLKKKIV